MKTKMQYYTPDERATILEEHGDKYLIEEHNITEGNFLVFSDVAPVSIEQLNKQIQQDNLMQFEVLATIYEELLMKG